MLALLSAALTAITGYVFVSRRQTTLYKGWEPLNQQGTVELTSLDLMQIIVVFLSILLKYIPGTRGNKTRLVPDAGLDGFNLQKVSLQGPISIVERDIETFLAAIPGQQDSTQLNPFFFVSFTTPLLLYVLCNHSCPIRPLGAVNTQNRFEFENANFCRDKQAILLASRSGSLSYTCTFGGKEMPGSRRKRGVEFDIVIEVKREKEVVLREHLSFLQFLPSSYPPRFNDQIKSEDKSSTTPTSTQGENKTKTFKVRLHIQANDPRRWAASCGDYNPIHISTIAAKAFGFRSVIAHGNHAIALAIQDTLFNAKKEEEDDTSRNTAAAICWNTKSRFTLQVRFVKPMILPAALNVEWQEKGTQVELRILSKESLCVGGELESTR